MEEWKECKLGDVLNFRRGHDLPHSKMKNGNVPVAGSNGIIGYHDEATPISPCITIGRSGNVGTPYIYEQCWAHNTVLYVDDFKNNYPLYLYYLLKTLPLSSFGGGSAVPTLNRNHIHPLIIKHTPNINTQKKIASILKSLDDKIEVNRRINENLEQQAQALFKSWFVDFEPFKDQPFVESELGMIPQGWRVKLLGSIIDIKYGKDHKKLLVGDIPVYGSGGLIRYAEKALYSGESVLIPRKGTLNNVMYVDEAFWTVDTMFYSIPKIANVMPFIYIFLCNRNLSSMNAGSAVPSMTTEILNNMKLVLPPPDLLGKFNSVFSSLFLKEKKNEIESRRLAELRDTLLPRLMSGELKVSDIRNI